MKFYAIIEVLCNNGSVIIIGPFRLYQILLIIITIFAIVFMYYRVRAKKTTPASFALWIIIWILINFFAFVPKISDPLAGFFGLGRGLDLLLIITVAVLVYLVFRLYIKIDDLNHNITDLVRELAIREEVTCDELDNLKTDVGESE